MGCIGTGGMGVSDMKRFLPRDDVQIVAVCDVDRSHRLDAKKLVEETYAEKKSSGTFKLSIIPDKRLPPKIRIKSSSIEIKKSDEPGSP